MSSVQVIFQCCWMFWVKLAAGIFLFCDLKNKIPGEFRPRFPTQFYCRIHDRILHVQISLILVCLSTRRCDLVVLFNIAHL